MSFFSSVCDAWLTELQTNVTGLDTTTIPSNRVHLYAPYSFESLSAERAERHLAIWPDGEPETVEGLLSDGSDLGSQAYTILIWEDASAESARGFDDDTANLAWLTLFEAVRDRLYRSANLRLGSALIMDTKYQGGQFAAAGSNRVMRVSFRVRTVHQMT